MASPTPNGFSSLPRSMDMDVFDVVDDSGALYEDTSFDITER